MKTEFTYIITIVDKSGLPEELADTRKCGLALFEKYKRNANCILIETKLRFDGPPKQKLVARQGQIGVAGDVGVYIIGNYYKALGTLESLLPAALARMLKEMEFESIRKICLVACNTAAVPKQNSGEQPFLHKFCEELAKSDPPPSLRPMIAGWESYVDIAVPGTVRRKVGTQTAFSDGELKEHSGGKMIQYQHKPDLYGFAKLHSNENAKLKHVVQFKHGSVAPVDLLQPGGWSDKQ